MRYLTGRYGVSTRRACRVVQATRSSAYYRCRRDPLTALRQRVRELAQARVRFGYRRLRVLLLREGWTVGRERFYRVDIEEGFALTRVPIQGTWSNKKRGSRVWHSGTAESM